MSPSSTRHAAATRIAALMVAAALMAGCGGTALPRAPSRAHEAANASFVSATRAFQRGDLQQARAQYGKALATAEAIEDTDLMGAALLNLTLVSARLGEYRVAHDYVDRIVTAKARFGTTLYSRAALRKALLYLDAPDLDNALKWADSSQANCTEPCKLAPALNNLRAYVALERGDAEAASGLAGRAVELASTPEMESEQSSGLRLLGRARMLLGDTAQAAEFMTRALNLDRSLGHSGKVALDLLYLADIEERRGNPEMAREYQERALAVYNATGQQKGAESLRARLKKEAAKSN